MMEKWDMDWIDLTQNRERRSVPVNTTMDLYMFQTVPVSITKSFSLYTHSGVIPRMSYRFAEGKLSANLYDIHHCCVQWKTPDYGQRNSTKLVKFNFKNKFEKLVHIVGIIIRNLSLCTVT
jgi:hypothetical protein